MTAHYSALDEMRNDGAPDVRTLSDRTQRSRIDRVCDTCKQPIKAGEMYRRIAMTVDGKFESMVIHDGLCIFDGEPL